MSSLDAKDRSRSPRFPSQSVQDAIKLVALIYKGVHRSPIDPDSAFQLMGFSGKTGTSSKALGAVRQFGLIEGVSNKTRVSDLALKILEPASEDERIDAITESANKPEVFELISQRFDGRVPSADEPVRAYLIRELGFSKSGSEECLKSLRESVEYVQGFARTSTASTEPLESNTATDRIKALAQEVEKEPDQRNSRAGELMVIPLTRDCNAELRFSGELTEKAMANLVRHIELMKEVWAED
jgi:hypothetical protein